MTQRLDETRMLVITDRVVTNTYFGNNTRFLSLLAALRELNIRIILLCTTECDPLIFEDTVERVVQVRSGHFAGGNLSDFSPTNFYPHVSELCAAFDPHFVLAEYAWMCRCFDYVGENAIKLADVHDLFFLRTQSFEGSTYHPWVYSTLREELDLLGNTDVVIAIQPQEKEILLKSGELKAVHCLPHSFKPAKTPRPGPSHGNSILFIGSNHAGNYGFIDFLNKCWPAILMEADDVFLDVYGGICTKLSGGPNLRLHGYVQNLENAYASANFAICPVVHGSGMKIKLMETFYFGRTAVVTREAIDGFITPADRIWLTARDWEEYARMCIELLRNDGLRSTLETNASRYYEKHYGWPVFVASLKDCLLDSLSAASAS